MKTQITFIRLDGGEGLALVNGHVSEGTPAKHALADKLGLPQDDDLSDSLDERIDVRLQEGGIDPGSIRVTLIGD